MNKILNKTVSILGANTIFNKALSALRLPSGILLIIANLVPILGVFLFGWNTFDIIILYWIENIVIGVFNALRMWYAKGENKLASNTKITINGKSASRKQRGSSTFLTGFFIVHYGMFSLVHGVFVMIMFGPHSSFFDGNLATALSFILALLISKGFSFAYNYIYKEEYLNISAASQMMKPYGRVIVIHLSIFVVGLISMSFPLPELAIVLFIGLKILLDLSGHAMAHLNNNAS